MTSPLAAAAAAACRYCDLQTLHLALRGAGALRLDPIRVSFREGMHSMVDKQRQALQAYLSVLSRSVGRARS